MPRKNANPRKKAISKAKAPPAKTTAVAKTPPAPATRRGKHVGTIQMSAPFGRALFELMFKVDCSRYTDRLEGLLHPASIFAIDEPVTVSFAVNYDRFAATHRVLDTFELREMILSCLPPADQWVARRVCTSFRDSTDHSSRLRKAMFRQADMTAPQLIAAPYRSPYLCVDMPRCCEKSVLVHLDRRWFRFRSALQESPGLQDMLIAQPPPSAATLSKSCACRRAPKAAPFRAVGAGLTFGDIVRAIEAMGRVDLKAANEGRCRDCRICPGWIIDASVPGDD